MVLPVGAPGAFENGAGGWGPRLREALRALAPGAGALESGLRRQWWELCDGERRW